MGMDATASIAFGILISEDSEVIWDTEDDRDIAGWWLKETGYKPPFELYAEGGGYAPGIETVTDKWGRAEPKNQQLVTDYYAAEREWQAAHPLPAEEVCTGSSDDTVYIFAIPGTVVWADWSEPKKFDPSALAVDADALAAFTAFCEKYGIEGEPAWYLGSYWG